MNPWADSLYAIIDAEVSPRPLEWMQTALSSGCAMVQLRAKSLDDRELLELATRARRSCLKAGIPFVVNDRADIARMVGADGLHLGQNDLRVRQARAVVGSISIGVSTHNLEQALEAERDGADLIALGPVFETTTKQNPDPVVGLSLLRHVCLSVSPPVVAIGGITPENANDTLAAGARYLAVISALPRFCESG
ncbi:MAG: thiamine phosphate synthase [Myxococcales bacterium]|jgi:thiamine-phosphate pyrophosphorylase